MPDAVEVIKQVGYRLDIGYWLIDLDPAVAYWPKGLGHPEAEASERGYRATPLDRMIERFAPDDRGRFRAFLAELVDGREARPIDLAILLPSGRPIHLRMAGRRTGQGRGAKVIGLVQVVDRWLEHERLARNLGFIVEALFISSDGGIVIFDEHLAVRRLNRNALDLFGVTEAEEESGDWAAVIEKRLPKATRDLLLEAIATASAVSGTFSLGGLGGQRLAWRANPWGSAADGMSGLVMTFTAKRQIRLADLAEREALDGRGEQPAAPAEAPPLPPARVALAAADEAEARHRALEWVKHPILLVSIATGEIAFANRAARDLYHLPADTRSFVENVYDLSGFTCDVDALAIGAAGGHVLRLKLGARVGRMLDYDADLLFVEYHETTPHLRPPPRRESVEPVRTPPVVGRLGAR